MPDFQQIFPAKPQAALDMGQPQQNGLEFPATLAERYRPKVIRDFIGLLGPKNVMTSLIRKPKPCAMLFVGPPGAGKTEMGMTFAAQLPGSLCHVKGQKCDVATLDKLNDQFAYYPPVGRWWVCLVDEADQMTDKAQVQLLSRLDGTASLKPVWGGGLERGTPPPVIWIFTCNGIGPEQAVPPSTLLQRFTSRCLPQTFPAPTDEEIVGHLRKICRREGRSPHKLDLAGIAQLANGNVRDAMMKLELALMGADPFPTKPVQAIVRVEGPTKLCPLCGATQIPRRWHFCQACWDKRKAERAAKREGENE
jgi:replication-associated recombination protein RarA